MRWKSIILIAGILLFALMAAAVIILETYDYNRFKPMIAGAVKQATGRELVIEGDIDFDLGWYPGIVARSLRFQNAPWGSRPDAITIGSVEIELALLPLVIGRIEIQQLIVDTPDILVETNSAGVTNFTFETHETTSKNQSVKTAWPRRLRLDESVLRDGHFQYRNANSDEGFKLDLNHFETEFDFTSSQVNLAFTGEIQNTPLQIKGHMDRPLPAILAGSRLPLEFRVQLAETEIQLAGDIEDPARLNGIALDLTAAGPSLPELLTPAGITDVPDLGAYRFKVHLSGSTKALTADGIELRIGSPDTATVAIDGRFGNLLNAEAADLAFAVQGQRL
jgi:uncharacterized protein involved in outer membrane biogenesis